MLSKVLVLVAGLAAVNPMNPGATVAKAERKPVDADVGDLSGYYTCKGVETGGKAYSGICTLSKKNEIYVVQWMVGGGAAFSGIGIRQGNTLAVSWTMPGEKGGIIRGVNLYRIETGPRLAGRWASVPGPGLLQSETLTFLKQMEDDD